MRTPVLRYVSRRALADRLILGAGTVTVLLAFILLAAGPIYAEAVTTAALRRTLADAPQDEASVSVSLRMPPNRYVEADEVVTAAARDALPAGSLVRTIESESFGLPSTATSDAVDVIRFRRIESIEQHATLVEGTWPGPDAPQSAAISDLAAAALGLSVGDTVAATERRDEANTRTVDIVGVYVVDDPADPFWAGDPLVARGAVESGGVRTVGPFVVSQAAIGDDLSVRLTATWRAAPDIDDFEVTSVERTRSRLVGLADQIDRALFSDDPAERLFSDAEVTTGLDRLLAGTDRSLTVTRAGVQSLLVQVAVLAGYALALTAGLLAQTRATETSLLRARGASPVQLLVATLIEAAMVTVPAAVIAPALALAALEALERLGPLAEIGLELSPTVSSAAYIVVAIAAVAAVIGIGWPTWRAARASYGEARGRSRQRRRTAAQRSGVDIALVVLAALALWQLRGAGAQITSRIGGRFGVDPMLVIAPSVGLLAGAVLALRIVPLLARVSERVVGAGRSVVPALSAWQVARRPRRYATSALLLIMAIGIGFFAAAYSATWLRSQSDQADFQIGADVRVIPDRRTGASVADLYLVEGHQSVPGVDRSMPVARIGGTLANTDDAAQVLAVASHAAAEVVQIRSDLTSDFPAAMQTLAAERVLLPTVPLPGEPIRLTLSVRAVEEPIEDEDGDELDRVFDAAVSVVVRDGTGLMHRLDVGRVPADERVHRLVADFTTTGQSALQPTYPLELLAIELSNRLPDPPERTVMLDLVELVASDSGADYPVDFERDPSAWTEDASALGRLFRLPGISATSEQPARGIQWTIITGAGFDGTPATFGIRPGRSAIPDAFPVVVSETWLAESGLDIGDVIPIPAFAPTNNRGRIAATAESFPTVDPITTEFVVADLPTMQAMAYETAARIHTVDEYWLAVTGPADVITGTLATPPFESPTVLDRTERNRALASDPVAFGTIGAFALGFVAAAVFAAVGFAVSAVVSARERLTEISLLRALGLSPGQLGRWLSSEQAVMVAVSLGFGTLVGVLLTAIILPLITITQDGSAAVPELIVVYPWRSVLILEIGLVLALAVVVAAISVALRRVGIGATLRMGDN